MVKRGLTVILVVLVALSLVACSTTAPPKTTVTGFFNALQCGDLDKAATFVFSEDGSTSEVIPMEEGQEDIIIKVFSKLSCELKSETIEGDKAIVKAAVTSLDLVRIAMQTMSELMPMAFAMAFSDNPDEMDALAEQYIMNSLSDPNAPTTITNVDVTLKKVEKQWLIVPDDALRNSITGNASKAFGG
ncbi:MAG: hypothetical protein U1D96_02320 [Eubacteriales bacterium]|nr:hypothetical protein [Eubacteriales bacterium]